MTSGLSPAPRRILYVAYHFPPYGGAGVQRNSKFVRYLREFGYEPIVLTGPGQAKDRWAPSDQTLKTDIPDDVDIVRVPGPEPPRAGGWKGRGERWLGRRSEWENWWTRNAVAAGTASRQTIDLIYVSLVPYSMNTAALELARRLDKPVVLDLQDPWALDEMWIYPSRLHRGLDLRRMRRALNMADAIVMNTPGSAKVVLDQFPELQDKLVVSIPNGFDSSDFAHAAAQQSDGRFRVVHSGYLHTDLGLQIRRTARVRKVLGGTVPGLDILTRSHVFLLEAVSQLIERRPDLAEVFEVHLLGALNETDKRVAAPYPFVQMHGYVPHAETIRLMTAADLLFLPMHNVPDGHRIPIVPGKTYEYLGSGRPILAAVPEGDARDLLAEAGNTRLCRPDDVEAMSRALLEELEKVRGGQRPAGPDPAVVARFERRKLTSDLASTFDSLLGPRLGSEAVRAKRR
jgi:glycosyltransferase involved in cell wall biosynthesis